jgi:hypothetical protein
MNDSIEIDSFDDILSCVSSPQEIRLDCTQANKGVDNYHIDVELSPAFVQKTRELIENQVKKIVTGNRLMSGNSPEFGVFRAEYADVMKVTLHRCKTDLTPGQVKILQFAAVKFVLQEIRNAIEKYSNELEVTQGQQKYAGSKNLLTTQEKIIWFRKFRNEFQFRISRLILRQMQRVDNNHLKKLRAQILGEDLVEAAQILYNPLLFAKSPQEPVLLLEYFILSGSGLNFAKLNASLELLLEALLPKLCFKSLTDQAGVSANHSEVFDELGGFFGIQSVMGASGDQKEIVTESFSWLENPENIRLLFDEEILDGHLQKIKNKKGLKAQWGLKSDLKKLSKILQEIRKKIAPSDDLKLLMASYTLKDQLSHQDLLLVSVEDALSVVAGNNVSKILAALDETKEGALALKNKLAELGREFDKAYKDNEDELFLKLLTDICRYRLHLKYYRFAHRVFNRVSVVSSEEELRLARAGGKLLKLMDSEELAQSDNSEPEIIHHAILKADVRGSTTVTQELMKQGLNPASYFSLRFFDPINERLKAYGAVKVFIEGDAVILGTYEYANNPAEWYSVSRACGMAKEMLDIITSKNSDSAKTGLPSLEIGVGICYLNENPLFLFDEGRPIMISSAIGDADRMSSCSWKLRGTFDSGDFNVEVLEIDSEDRARGEKGQDFIRYNVNGILLDDAAFAKLQSELNLSQLNVRSGDKSETVHVGKFPDVQGKERYLVIREGVIGLWKGDEVIENPESTAVFYEVLPNTKFANQIINLAETQSN